MNFCKKCGEKLENGTCPNCFSNTNQVFCRKCGEKLKNGVCSSCTLTSSTTKPNLNTVDTTSNIKPTLNTMKDSTFKETEIKKPMSSNQKKLIICSCALLVICVGSFFGFKVYKDKLQDKYAKEAISLIEAGDFEGADEILEKYKKNDASILELKDLNTLYLDIKKECSDGNYSRVALLNDTVLKSAHSGSYIDEITRLKTLSLKVASLNELNNIDALLKEGNITASKSFVENCEKYDLTDEEKAKVSEATAKIDAASDKLKKEEEKKRKEAQNTSLKNSFKERYRSLSSDYNDSFYSSMYSNLNLSEAEKSAMLRDIAMTWDRLLNDIWKYLQANMEPAKFETLKKSQIKWVDEKMEIENWKNDMHMSGNAFAQNQWFSLGYMNKERVKFLIDNYL